MKQSVVRVGDEISHSDVVLSGARGLTFMGKSVACLGDKVSFPKHGDTNPTGPRPVGAAETAQV